MQLAFPTSGSATILGRPLGDPAMKRRIGYLAENPYFYDHLTAEELLRYFAGLFGYRGRELTGRVDRFLDLVRIGAERRLPLRKFSKGMIQRVGLAQALINDPEVVFLDEPMSGLDPLGRREVRSLISALRAEGRTVFFSSHILSDAETLCNRVAILAGGRLVATGQLREMLEFTARGWDAGVDRLTPEALARLGPGVVKTERIAEGQYVIEFSADRTPQDIVATLDRLGARLLTLAPVRETLEDFFVRQVSGATWDRFVPAAPSAPADPAA
jgi:ABC-2 type transport system ATP-binding protein